MSQHPSGIRDPQGSYRMSKDVQGAEFSARSLLESAPDAMVIANQEGHIILVNAQTQQLFGYTAEEIVGQPIEMLVPKRFHDVHP
jgi:PAS domain S-box-containing protein